MEHSENFISLAYSNIDFLVKKDLVKTAFSFSEKDILEDESKIKRVPFLSQQIACIDFDKYVEKMNQNFGCSDLKKCIILECSNILPGENQIALTFSAECKVKKIKYKDFSLFSDFYTNFFEKKGILACSFKEKGFVSYLIDIETFLRYQEQ